MDTLSQTIAEWRDFYAAVAGVGAMRRARRRQPAALDLLWAHALLSTTRAGAKGGEGPDRDEVSHT
jgi:hypothetical protein